MKNKPTCKFSRTILHILKITIMLLFISLLLPSNKMFAMLKTLPGLQVKLVSGWSASKNTEVTTTNFTVSSLTGWQETSLYISAGEEFTVSYVSGTWTLDKNPGSCPPLPGGCPYVGPEGYPPDIDPNFGNQCRYAYGIPMAALLGKIGSSGTTFAVRRGGTFTASASGSLYLRINDQDHCQGDNAGSVTMNMWNGTTPPSPTPTHTPTRTPTGTPTRTPMPTLTPTPTPTPGDPFYPDQWGLHRIDIEGAWEQSRGSDDIVIAIIDSGVDYTHPDLDNDKTLTNIDYDFAYRDNDAMDDDGHGTHVAGIAAANTNNNQGIAGVCPRCRILPLKTLYKSGSGDQILATNAIWYAVEQGSDIINMSIGWEDCKPELAVAINHAYDNNVTVVSASGNSCPVKVALGVDDFGIKYPAIFERVIAVGATDNLDLRADSSNYGPELDLVAPGRYILSTYLNRGYKRLSGTSMAAPMVAGVAGLILSQNPSLTPAQVQKIIEESAVDIGDIGWDEETGWGRLDANLALQMYSVSATPAPPASCPVLSSNQSTESNAEKELITLYTRLRNDFLSENELGQYYIGLFYNNSPELVSILLTNSDLRDRTAQFLDNAAGAFESLLPDSTAQIPVVLEQSLYDEANDLTHDLALAGDDDFEQLLLQVWRDMHLDQYIGRTTTEIWEDMQQKAIRVDLYLPLILRGYGQPTPKPSGVFQDSGQRLGNSDSWSGVLGDLDSDGDLDAFIANRSNQPNTVWFNNGTGVFNDSGQRLGSLDSEGVALGDLNNDGDLDVYVVNGIRSGTQADEVWFNDGNGNFSNSGQQLDGSYGVTVALGDLDGDGDLDAFVVNWDGQVDTVWINNGLGYFVDSGQRLGSFDSGDVALGDLDGDGDLDAYVGVGREGVVDKIWINDGSGHFSDSNQSLRTSVTLGVALGDLDSDGDLDVFVVHRNGAQPNEVWINDGRGHFTNSEQSLGTAYSEGVSLGDIDADGDLDAIVANAWSQSNQVWVNNGFGFFSDSGQQLGSANSRVVPLGDLDGDNDLDIFSVNSNGYPNEVWFNQ